MKKVNVTALIQRAYGRKYQLHPTPSIFTAPQYYLSKARPMVALIAEKRFQIGVAILLTVVIVASIYYFNILVQTQQDVLAASGKVDAFKQRRNDISINLSKAVLDYSKHEQSVFATVVSLRTLLAKGKGSSAELTQTLKKLEQNLGTGVQMPAAMVTGAGSLAALDRLLAVAEQYPDLKLSTNFQSLMTALIDVEKDLAAERIRYNDAANYYTTTLYKFPTNFYAWIFGFKDLPYFEATDDAKRFKAIEY